MHTHGKVAVVTGAGTGIGKAVAQILLRNNYAVTLTGRRQELLEQTAVDSGADPEKIYCVRADIRYEKDVNQIFDGTVDRFGRIDFLINNAAGNFMVSAENLTAGGLATVLGIDLQGG
ncbi:MAG: SDR family NAD(P)-dependent oxidoreductase, partial [Proteobacteria bacterium]|nr:SDR family NAD(P)-dependent oxidoreductase [Pseudomonadota bacterium]